MAQAKLDPHNPFAKVSEERKEKLLNKQLIEDTYNSMNIKDSSKHLDVSAETFRRALKYHGIRVRKKGEMIIAHKRITRNMIILAAMKAYMASDRCPPNCSGKATCLDNNGKCILGEQIARLEIAC